MPTPIAHAVAGIAVAGSVRLRRRLDAWLIGGVAAIALLPDLDFLLGFLVGAPHRYHRGPTHSLIGIALISVVVAPVVARVATRGISLNGSSPATAGRSERDRSGFEAAGRDSRSAAWVLTFVVLLSHLIADAIMPDPGGGVGLPMFWPFTSDHVAAPLPLPAALADALEIRFDGPTSRFLGTMFSVRTALVFVIEGILFSPLLLAPYLVRRIVRGRGESGRAMLSDQGKIPRSR